MSPEQTAAYLARFRDRIATFRQNVTVISLKGRITNTVRRQDSLGRRGENACVALAASLGMYYTGGNKSEEDLRDVSPEHECSGINGEEETERNGGEEDGDGDVEDEGDPDWDGRSDSMEPLRDSEREEIVDGEGDEDADWESDRDGHWDGQWELDMDREEERIIDAEHRMAEERSSNADEESELYVAYHSINSRAMRKTRLDSVEKMYQSGGRYSTVCCQPSRCGNGSVR
jgi:hypothetical protein